MAEVGDKQARSTRHRKKVFRWPVFPRRKDAEKGDGILLIRLVILQGCTEDMVEARWASESSCEGKKVQV